MKMCLLLQIHGWLGKTQWNIITWKRRFLESLHLYMENVTDGDYANAKRICKDFEIKSLG